MGELLELFNRKLRPEQRAHLIQRVADLSVQIALLESEREWLEKRLNGDNV